MSALNATLESSKHSDKDYVQFFHASINGKNQYTRLTSKLVAKHMPNAMVTARGHLDRTPANQPHDTSQAVSALRRLHADQHTLLKSLHPSIPQRSLEARPCIWIRLQTICTSGTQYLQFACWGHYIHLQPLTSMSTAQTTQAFTNSVNFFRNLGISLTQLRMDNQWSEDLRDVAVELEIHIEFISTEAKRANRAERAIRTAKNHIVATRAGFHPDFSHAFLDKCLPQIELALNVIHPFEYDNNISAYEGLYRAKFDFKRHPIAPLGCKVLTWDALENRGSWADHGIEGMYIGPALNHFRSFSIWVPSTSVRIANTVW
jgi:hypothetical protein